MPKPALAKLLEITMAIARNRTARSTCLLTAILVFGCKSGSDAEASAKESLRLENDEGLALTYQIPVSPTDEVSLKNFKFKSESELLRESGIVPNSEYDDSVAEMTAWISRSLSPSAREKISKKCASLYGSGENAIRPAAHNLACLPWQLERYSAQNILKKRQQVAQKAPQRLVVVKTEEHWKELAGKPFYDSFLRVDPVNVTDLQTIAIFSEKTAEDCKFGGATAALISRAEAFLPDPAAASIIEKSYPIIVKCMKPDEEGFERTHQRMGLLHLMKGDQARAKEALLRAREAKEPAEDFRTLFWLGVIVNNETPFDPQYTKPNEPWETLVRKFPLSLHSVLASHSMGIDPMERLASGDDLKLKRRSGPEWTEFDSAAFIFELLIARQDANTLEPWSKFVARNIEPPNAQTTLFTAVCQDAAENYRSGFALLTRYLKDTKRENVSIEFLRLMFPHPYAEEVLAQSGSVDPLLILALIRQESAFDPFARSSANARGLMQVLPSTARHIKAVRAESLYEPTTNIEVGTRYVKDLLKKYNGTVEHVLASYNAGGRNLDKWKTRYPDNNILLFADLIPFKETRIYVSIILRNAYWYGRLMVMNNDKLAQTVMKKSSDASWKSTTVNNLLQVAWSKIPGAHQSVASIYALGSPVEQAPSTPVNSVNNAASNSSNNAPGLAIQGNSAAPDVEKQNED